MNWNELNSFLLNELNSFLIHGRSLLTSPIQFTCSPGPTHNLHPQLWFCFLLPVPTIFTNRMINTDRTSTLRQSEERPFDNWWSGLGSSNTLFASESFLGSVGLCRDLVYDPRAVDWCTESWVQEATRYLNKKNTN